MEKLSDGRRGIIAGIVLIGLGILFLVDRVVGIDIAEAGWPLFVILPGVVLFGWGVTMSGREGLGLAVAGGITTVVGLILAVQNATGLWATWAYAWALVGPGGSGLGMAGYGLARRDGSLVTAGLRSIAAGVGLFLAFGLFFEGLIGLSGRPFLTTEVGPYILIVAGLAVVAVGLVRSRRPAG
jgi:hypothetical protein